MPEGFTVRTSDPWNAESMRDATQTVTLTATNTPIVRFTSIVVDKQWFYGGAQVSNYSDVSAIYFNIYKDGSNQPYNASPYSITAADGWTWNSGDLPLGTYTVKECNSNGNVITTNVTYANNGQTGPSTHIVIKNTLTDCEGEKRWDDKGVANLVHPAITLLLKKTVGETTSEVDSYVIQKNASGSALKHKWTNLPAVDYATGNAITYSVDEYAVTGFTKSVSGNVVTNTLETINIPVNKTWLNNGNATTTWPTGIASVTVTLYRGQTSTGRTLQLAADNNTTAKFTDVPKYDINNDGTATEITDYTVRETAVTGYASQVSGSISGFTVTNTPEKTQVTVTKNWTDSGTETHDEDWVKVKLYRNNAGVAEVTLNNDNDWTTTWSNLPVVDDVTGMEYIYAVVETGYHAQNGLTYTSDSTVTNPKALTKHGDSYTVTINNTPGETIDVEAVKTWTGGKWPADVTVSFQLKQNSTAYRDPVSVDANTPGQKASWTGLPKADDSGANYAYTVDETVTMTVGETTYTLQADRQYTAGTPASSEEAGKKIWTINNTFTTVDVPVKKVWTGGTPLADAVRFTLTANSSTEVKNIYGNVITSTVKLDVGNNWTNTTTFVNLPQYAPDGTEIDYRLAETGVLIGEDKAENWRSPKEFFTVSEVRFNQTTKQWEIENTRHEATITIAKVVKGTSTALKGAIFQIKRQLPNETAPALFDNPAFTDDQQYGKVLSIQEEGAKVDISGLLPGIYTVTEVKAPSGYIIMASSFTFTIAVDGTVTYSAEGNDGNGLVTYTSKGNESYDTFTVGNESGVALPATGGVGTGVVYGAGAALVLLAVLGMILTRRKRTDGEGIR